MAPQDAAVSGREQKILDIIETTRAKRPRFKADQVTMAHGAGGKATQTMIEGLFVPAFALRRRRGGRPGGARRCRHASRSTAPASR